MNRFDLAYYCVLPPALLAVRYKMWKYGKYRDSLPAMFGKRLGDENLDVWKNGCIWVHAVSVGEVTAAKVMLPYLREFAPDLPILLTTHTETGQAAAKKLEGTMADAVRYYPVDLSSVVERFADTYKPRVFIPMETELWPNALDVFAKSGTQIVTLNGKVSERSFGRYMKVQSLIRRPLSRVVAFCVQTDGDRERIGRMSGRADNIFVTGNCKFDEVIAPVAEDERVHLRDLCGLAPLERPLTVGSTHGGEEDIILEQWRSIESRFPNNVLVLVPRHPERFSEVWQAVKDSGMAAVRISNGEVSGLGNRRVILMDKMGILTRLYGISDVAVIAGSFVPGIGGHNLMEAAAHGVPVIYGPYMRSQPDMVRILSPENGGTRVEGGGLAIALAELLDNEGERQIRGEKGRLAFAGNQGAALRNMEVLRRYVDLSTGVKGK